MGSGASAEWGPDTWITCEECGWGAQGGTDHIEIDGIRSVRDVILCRWCFDVPNPPFWTTFPCTKHYLSKMKVLPEDLQDGPCVEMIAECLISYGRFRQATRELHQIGSEKKTYVQMQPSVSCFGS